MTNEIIITTPEIDDDTLQAITAAQQWAGALVISDAKSYAVAATAEAKIKERIKAVEARFDAAKKAAHAAHKQITGLVSELTAPMTEAAGIIRDKRRDWQTEQDRIRREEQARLQAIADAEAKRERERLEREASKLKTESLREQRLEQAASIVAPVVEVATSTPNVGRQALRTRWVARLTDKAALIKAAADGNQIAQALLVFDQSAANRQAVACKGAIKIPGVEFVSELV